eukprot:scaffold138522_cov64-Attheya_sp.AAC.2
MVNAAVSCCQSVPSSSSRQQIVAVRMVMGAWWGIRSVILFKAVSSSYIVCQHTRNNQSVHFLMVHHNHDHNMHHE